MTAPPGAAAPQHRPPPRPPPPTAASNSASPAAALYSAPRRIELSVVRRERRGTVLPLEYFLRVGAQPLELGDGVQLLGRMGLEPVAHRTPDSARRAVRREVTSREVPFDAAAETCGGGCDDAWSVLAACFRAAREWVAKLPHARTRGACGAAEAAEPTRAAPEAAAPPPLDIRHYLSG